MVNEAPRAGVLWEGEGPVQTTLDGDKLFILFSRGSPVLRKSFEQLANTYMIRVTLGIKYCYTSPGGICDSTEAGPSSVSLAYHADRAKCHGGSHKYRR